MADRKAPEPAWTDERLVDRCLAGDERAWSALVDKYQKLVYAIVRKYRADPEEAADLFQAVWLDAFNDLPKLRKRSAVRSWLISLATHKCYHWKVKQRRQDFREGASLDTEEHAAAAAVEPEFAAELERDQLVREAILQLSPRCRELIEALFFASPPRPYQEVAASLGLATGSIGFIRGRCLKRLRAALEQLGELG